MKFRIITILVFFVSINSTICQNQIISATAGYNTGLVLENKSSIYQRFSLSVSGKSNYREKRVLAPGERWAPKSPAKRWNKSLVHKVAISTEPNLESVDFEINKNEEELRAKIAQLNQWKGKNIEANNNELAIRVAAEVAANVSDNPNGGFWENSIRGGVRFLGKVVRFTFNASDILNMLNGLEKKSIDQIASDIILSQAQQLAAKKAGRVIGRYFDVAEELPENVLMLLANYIGTDVEIEDKYQQFLAKYNSELESKNRNVRNRYSSAKRSSTTLKNLSFESKPFNFQLDLVVQPLNYGNRLNEYWESNPERFLVKKVDVEDEYDIEDALWNTNLAAKVRFTITPAFRFIGKSNRIYASGGIINSYYDLDRLDGFSLPNNVFSSTGQGGFSTRYPIVYELRQINYGALYRIGLSSKFALDLEGGFVNQSGRLNFKYAELNEGFDWSNEIIDLTDKQRSTYYSASLLYGRLFRRSGLSLYVTYHMFQSELSQSDEFPEIVYRGSNTGENATINTSDKFLHRVLVGLSFNF